MLNSARLSSLTLDYLRTYLYKPEIKTEDIFVNLVPNSLVRYANGLSQVTASSDAIVTRGLGDGYP